MSQQAKNNDAALDAFLAKKDEIDAALERLQALSNDHFDTLPDDINWGYVGTLARYADALKELTDQAFGEGEHAA